MKKKIELAACDGARWCRWGCESTAFIAVIKAARTVVTPKGRAHVGVEGKSGKGPKIYRAALKAGGVVGRDVDRKVHG